MQKLLRLGAVAALAVGMTGLAVPANAATTHIVKPGMSIQAAVKRAMPGDTIVLRPGTYFESVTIRKDGITLRGSGATARGTVLKPPATPRDDLCTRAVGGGVCVFGTFDRIFGPVTERVKNVRVSNIMFEGWENAVLSYGAHNLFLDSNFAKDVGDYGFARFDTTGGAMITNRVENAAFAGLYLGDTPRAMAFVAGNKVTGSTLGMFIRHARHIDAEFNTFSGNCQGVLVFDDGQVGGVGNVNMSGNVVRENNKFCPGGEGAPALKGGGILLLGATESRVADNTVTGNRGTKFNSGGIVLLDAGPITGGSAPINNRIARNVAFRNSPDIRWDRSGSGNAFVANRCDTSVPTWICD